MTARGDIGHVLAVVRADDVPCTALATSDVGERRHLVTAVPDTAR